jgi:hypothetical protein
VHAHLEQVDFDPYDLPGYAGRLYDIFERDPALLRLSSWYQLERESRRLPAVVAANDVRIKALMKAQREGRLTKQYKPEAILALVQAIASSWARLNPEFRSTQPDTATRRRTVVDAVAQLFGTD